MGLGPKERPIHNSILQFLSYKRDSLVKEIRSTGVPIRQLDGRYKMITSESRFSVKYMSDISFLWRGDQFYFEVKRPDRATISFLHKIDADRSLLMRWANKKRTCVKKRMANQYLFIEDSIRAGAWGGFVYSVAQVERILEKRPTEISIPDIPAIRQDK